MQTVDSITASQLLRDGRIIIYPTEAIYGIGCDPWNKNLVKKIFEIKKRPLSKPMIIIGSDIKQMTNLIDIQSLTETVTKSWPGHTTWLIPSSEDCPEWLKDAISGKVAIRISKHETVREICDHFGKPIISTSANLSNTEPSKNRDEVKLLFSSIVEHIVEGSLGGSESPSIIKDMLTEQNIRS
tara:strand:+ start:277 stop:828 length:552 start_codon:yes stop_codon:yes gene_type:complete